MCLDKMSLDNIQMHVQADDIVLAANQRVGRKYKHLGRGPVAYDCVGVLIDVAHELELTPFDTASYSRRPNVEEFTRFMRASGCTRIPVSDLCHGDILRLAYDKWPVHTGIFERDGDQHFIVHAFLPYRRVVREEISPDIWARLNAVWRFPE